MGIRTMKFDLFVLKALEKKGYTLDKLMELEDEVLDELNLPEKIISQIKGYKLRGGKTPQQVAEEIAALMEADSETNMEESEVLSTYKDDVKSTIIVEVPDIQTEEDAKDFIEKVKENLSDRIVVQGDSSISIETDGTIEIKTDGTVDMQAPEVEIVRTLAKSEDIQIIKEALRKKELRSFASYTKLLKTEVPEAILSAVESTTLNTLIDERIAEVKASSTK